MSFQAPTSAQSGNAIRTAGERTLDKMIERELERLKTENPHEYEDQERAAEAVRRDNEMLARRAAATQYEIEQAGDIQIRGGDDNNDVEELVRAICEHGTDPSEFEEKPGTGSVKRRRLRDDGNPADTDTSAPGSGLRLSLSGGGGSIKRARKSPREINGVFFIPTPEVLANAFDLKAFEEMLEANATPPEFDLLGKLSQVTELVVEVGKYLSPRDLLNLYSISRDFHRSINANLTSSVRAWSREFAPTAGKNFPFKLYRRLCIADPGGRTALATGASGSGADDENIKARRVPAMRWLQFVAFRERVVHDILAALARCGHRMPKSMRESLCKMWMLMDVPTNIGREAMVRSDKLWTDNDLYNVQLFVVKLDLRFNDPIYGPGTETLRKLMLGQREGLTPLWQLLTRQGRFKTAGGVDTFDIDERAGHPDRREQPGRPSPGGVLSQIIRLKLRYDYRPRSGSAYKVSHVFGVAWRDMGAVQLEGWGRGCIHLARPDELVACEAVCRNLDLESHIKWMALWGNIDWATGKNMVPSLEEMILWGDMHGFREYDYFAAAKAAAVDEVDGISSAAKKQQQAKPIDHNDPDREFTDDEWKPRHAAIKKWRSQPKAQRRAYRNHRDNAILNSLAWPDIMRWKHMQYWNGGVEYDDSSDDEDRCLQRFYIEGDRKSENWFTSNEEKEMRGGELASSNDVATTSFTAVNAPHISDADATGKGADPIVADFGFEDDAEGEYEDTASDPDVNMSDYPDLAPDVAIKPPAAVTDRQLLGQACEAYGEADLLTDWRQIARRVGDREELQLAIAATEASGGEVTAELALAAVAAGVAKFAPFKEPDMAAAPAGEEDDEGDDGADWEEDVGDDNDSDINDPNESHGWFTY